MARLPHAERDIPFGREKGKKLSDPTITEKNLAWLRQAMADSAADPEKERYKADNEGWVEAIDKELARRINPGAGVTAPPTNGGMLTLTVWQCLCALDPSIPGPVLKDLAKRTTGKVNARDLTVDDISKVVAGIVEAKKASQEDVPF